MKEELKRMFQGGAFWIAFVSMLLGFLAVSIPEWIQVDLPNRPEWRASALVKSVTPVWFGGIMLLLPFCSNIACVSAQVEDIRSNYAIWQAIRSSMHHYMMKKVIAAFVSGFVVCAGAFWVHAILWNFIAIPVNPSLYPDHELYLNGLLANWYCIAYGLPMYIWIGFAMGLCGALTAMIGLATASWIPDKLIAVTLPVGVYFFWSYDLIKIVFGISLPRPSGLYNSNLTTEVIFDGLLMNAVVFAFSMCMYYFGIRRRIKNV